MDKMQVIKRELDQELKAMDYYMKNFPWENSLKYAAWLSQTYYYVCHSTRLLCLTGAHCSQADNRFHLRSIEHMKEEKSHEVLAFRDLRELGFSADNFAELPVTQALYQTVSYQILNRDPLALYGYILCLEGIAVTSAGHCASLVRNAYPNKKVGSFLEVHGEEDPDHLEKALAILADLPVSRLEIIRQMMHTSFYFYKSMLQAAAQYQGVEDSKIKPVSAYAN